MFSCLFTSLPTCVLVNIPDFKDEGCLYGNLHTCFILYLPIHQHAFLYISQCINIFIYIYSVHASVQHVFLLAWRSTNMCFQFGKGFVTFICINELAEKTYVPGYFGNQSLRQTYFSFFWFIDWYILWRAVLWEPCEQIKWQVVPIIYLHILAKSPCWYSERKVLCSKCTGQY